MKRLRFVGISLVAMVCLTSMTCDREEESYKRSQYEVLVMDRSVFENSIRFEANQPVRQAGKIYVYKSWIFISDVNKGFHVYDNTDAESPRLKGFLTVPGATDMAIRDDVVYINQAVDLVALEINPSINQSKILKRIKFVFPDKSAPDGYVYHTNDESKVVVDWIKK